MNATPISIIAHTAIRRRRLQHGAPRKSPRGFALVVTLSLMALLTVLVVALLSMSATNQRGSSQADAQLQAQANARLAMMMAIGDLQNLAGHDTRITAGSNLFSEDRVRATGVWRSWEGSDRDTAGKPIPPDYTLKTEAGNPELPIGTDNEGRFLGWLASPLANASPDSDSLAGLSSAAVSGTVPLVASGSVINPEEQVHATPTMVTGNQNQGAFAWWVSGDNSKAMLNVDPADKPSSTVDWHTRMKSNGRADPESFGLAELDALPTTKHIPSRATLRLVDGTVDTRRLHDLTTHSRGLLTNSATGGWRRDLSLLSENYAALPKLELPSLTTKPGVIQTFSKAKDDAVAPWEHPPNPLLYPWETYVQKFANGSGWRQVPPICSWTALTDFMLQYRHLTSSTASNTTMPVFAAGYDSYKVRFEYQDQVRRSPVIARIQWIFSLCSRQKADPNADPADPGDPRHSNTHQAALLITPVVTLWNPYNVELNMPNGFRITFDNIAPLSFRFRIGDNLYPETSVFDIYKFGSAGYMRYFNMEIKTPITLAPGASQIFGLNDNIPVEDAKAAIWGQSSIVLEPGYRPNGGYMFYGLNEGAEVYGKAADTFAVEEFAFRGTETGGTATDFGMYMEFWVNAAGAGNTNTGYNGHRMVYDKAKLGGDDIVNALYPTVSNTISASLQEVEGIRNKPFVGAIFGYKPATPRPREAKFNNLHSKGMLNNHPLCFYSELGEKSKGLLDAGAYHPANAPYEFSFQDVNGWNDTQAIPQFELSTNSGYIISGLTPGDGLTRCVVAELPTRPLQSLAELQHFDARNNNPVPPYQFNLIGNGSANPIFAPDMIRLEKVWWNMNKRHFVHDDTFILNHMLFDDWFVSSIAPELNDFAASQKRSITEVYQDHLDFKTPLANRFYRPSPDADQDFDVTASTKDPDTEMFAYETVASELEVEGMINVNSVSKEVWKSWLRQGRDARVAYLDANGATQLDAEQSFAFPRTTIAGDSAAGSGSTGSNPLFPDADEFAGYRTLSETQIEALAEEIVNEVRERGPFLSLSEFVNRRLTTDKSLAAAGTIQQALDTLAEDSSSTRNPYTKIQENAVEITTLQPGITDHKFPEAALGSSAFGVPGWIRQADILTRLAPMLSVRDDTFTIRAYGDARDPSDNAKILARAWCEVVVCRRADYLDPADPKQINPHSPAMTSAANQRFGRRFEIVSFRWLAPEEI